MKNVLRKTNMLTLLLALGAGVVRAAEVPMGKELFEKKCSACHGKDLKGNPAMLKLLKAEPVALDLVDAETLGKKDAELIATTTKGKGKMLPQEGKLTAEQIASAIAYLRSNAPQASEPSK